MSEKRGEVRVAIGALLVAAACAGPAGPRGAAGKDGEDGTDGKDGVVARVLPTWADIHGDSYENWAGSWWEWSGSMKGGPGHPLWDATGADCAKGQAGAVWFLGGSFLDSATTTRNCTVPAETTLFFPIMNMSANNVDEATDHSCSELQGMAAGMVTDPFEPVLEIDGVAQPDMYKQYVAPTECRTVSYVADSPLSGEDGSAGTTLVGHNGYYVALRPFDAGGTHKVRFKGGYRFTTAKQGFDFDFKLDITYNVTVEAKRTWAAP